MATLKKRGNKYTVIYDYYDADGKRHQKWEAFDRKEDAEKYRKKIEYQKVRNAFLTPSDQTVEEYLMSWVSLYGKSKWSCSMCTSSLALLRNHIIPEIGQIAVQKLQPIHIEMLYNALRTKKCGGAKGHAEDKDRILVSRPLLYGTFTHCSKPHLTKLWTGKSSRKIRSPVMHRKRQRPSAISGCPKW